MARRCVNARPIAMFVIAAAAFGSSAPARAQVDLNLQTRLQIFSPPLTTLPLNTAPKKDEIRLANNKCVSKNDRAVQRAFIYHNTVRAPIEIEHYLQHPEELAEDLLNSQKAPRDRLSIKFTQLPFKPFIYECMTAQPTNLAISGPFNPTYESNVLKSNTNVQRDISQGFGGTMLLTGPGLKDRAFDLVAFGVTSASARYSAFPSKSFDALTEQGFYQIFLGAFSYADKGGTPFNIYPKAPYIPAANLITVDTLSLGFQNQTAFTPGYRVETANLFTPQATLGRQNISLSGSDVSKQCMSASGLGFCNYADLSLTVGQTFSDVTPLQNANVAASATLGWRINNSDWKVTVPVVVTAKEFENVVGGRRDALVQGGAVLGYVLPTKSDAPALSFSLAGTYYRNYSTLAAAAWHGFVIQPTITIAFNPPIPFKEPKM
jgi:hypothetical protein